MKLKLILTFLVLLAITGCSSNSTNDAANGSRKHPDAPKNMSNRSAGHEHRHFVENDITNQNPNFLDLSGTGSGSERGSNIGLDVDKARQVVGQTKDFKPGSVWINGNRMRITVYKKGIKNEQDRRAAEAMIHRKLIEALPRYTIDVTVKEDRD